MERHKKSNFSCVDINIQQVTNERFNLENECLRPKILIRCNPNSFYVNDKPKSDQNYVDFKLKSYKMSQQYGIHTF